MARDITKPVASLWPHRAAVVVACAMFPLLVVGGLVTTYDAGMAVPDWPNTYGYNLFLYPWETWLSGPWDLFIEHGHRLLGAAVGALSIVWVVMAHVCHASRAARGLAWLTLGGVITQGLLGGFRVLADERWLAFAHGCLGPAVFTVAVLGVAVSSRSWERTPREATASAVSLSVSTAALAYFQLALGAVLRHLLLVLPPQGFRAALVFHLIGAAVLMVLSIRWMLAARRLDSRIAWGSAWMAGLVMVQILLGASAYVLNYGWPSWVANWQATAAFVVPAGSFQQSVFTTAHVGLGAWIVALAWRNALWTWRAAHDGRFPRPAGASWAGAVA